MKSLCAWLCVYLESRWKFQGLMPEYNAHTHTHIYVCVCIKYGGELIVIKSGKTSRALDVRYTMP